MMTWASEHYVLTFILAFSCINLVNSAIDNVTKVITSMTTKHCVGCSCEQTQCDDEEI